MAGKKRSPSKGSASRKPASPGRDASAEISEPGDGDALFPIVGIGASAGGLEALEELVGNLPLEGGMAFVVVTHQHPGHTSLLPELLSKETEMPVTTADDGTRILPNRIYVGQPGGNLAILNGVLHRMDPDRKESPRLPIDYFFRSLAEDQHERAICIILSGTGTDGTIGLKAIKAASGMAIVQQPQSAKYAGMPSSAIATGLADYILAPGEMPGQLVGYAKGPYLRGGSAPAEIPAVTAEPMQKIFVLLRGRTGHDFSAYKNSTLRRRIERRMNVHQIDKPDHYVRYLQENPHEIDLLFKEFLISVTHFFRDTEAWAALEAPFDELLGSRPENYTLRVWTPGCATGEEVYSIVMMLRESMNRVDHHFDVQAFGTDLDADAIGFARAGYFPEGIAGDLSPERLERYFVREENLYRIRNEVREMAIFAEQNVIKDPPFTKLDIISCRNLLIYLNAGLQKKLLPIFHYALKPGGLLFLGPSETVGAFGDLFEIVDKRWKIFRRKECNSATLTLPEFPAHSSIRLKTDEVIQAAGPSPPKEQQLPVTIERLLVDRYVPASVVVTDRGNIVYIHGRTGNYLEPSAGQPRNNLLEMAREGLTVVLASALRLAAASGNEVVRENVRVRTNSKFSDVDLSVRQLQEPEEARGLLLVSFRPSPVPVPAPEGEDDGSPGKAVPGERFEELDRELKYARESLQTTVEELETSNEELKSTNEELQSTNEELQSANEELETSKEEMQSLNEELTTVNAELQSKVDELSQANNDMQNLLNSTDIATVFLDNDLQVKRYTDQANQVVNLIPTDVGRPINDLAIRLKEKNLTDICQQVIGTLVFHESEVQTVEGGWYLMRIMPYRTTDQKIDGLVITFVNIDQLKDLEKSGEIALQFFESIVNTVREPLVILDGALRAVLGNRAFYHTFQTNVRQTNGELIFNVGSGQWDVAELRRLLEDILPKDQAFQDYEVEAEFPKIGRRVFSLNGCRLDQKEGMPGRILLSFNDVTNP